MPERINELAGLGITGIDFEPLSRCGRANETGAIDPASLRYIRAF